MVRKRIKKIVESQVGPEFFLVVGIVMVFGTLIKLLGIADFSSDFFWFITGLSLVSEGIVLVAKKQRYNKRYIAIKQ